MKWLAPLLLTTICLLAGWAPGQGAEPERPNILVILADDLGYADIGVHGCEDIPTPHIDSLAASGVRCTSGYSSHPFCSPMRASLMAGRYQHRFGYVSNVPYDPQNILVGLPTSEKTVAKRLQEAGYQTGMAGKWHLGAAHVFHPNRRGFDFFYGFLGGGHDYFKVDLHRPMGEGYFQPLERNGKPEDLKTYLTEALSNEAVAFIERNKDKPFFFYLAYNAPHTPMQAPEPVLQAFEGIPDKKRRQYAAMVHIMDAGIGRVIQALKEHGLHRRTIVFFLSDNGGPTFSNGSNNDPLRGDKGDVFEGGIRVPFIVSWPGVLPAGTTYDHPVISLDVSRTALALGQARIVPKLEGVNLVPYLSGKVKTAPHQALFWRKDNGTDWAVRSGNRKLLKTRRSDQQELFDLEADLAESTDIRSAHPDEAKSLYERYQAWNAKNVPPSFPSFRAYHQRKREFYKDLPFEPVQAAPKRNRR